VTDVAKGCLGTMAEGKALYQLRERRVGEGVLGERGERDATHARPLRFDAVGTAPPLPFGRSWLIGARWKRVVAAI
jgi:hypothetical protein